MTNWMTYALDDRDEAAVWIDKYSQRLILIEPASSDIMSTNYRALILLAYLKQNCKYRVQMEALNWNKASSVMSSTVSFVATSCWTSLMTSVFKLKMSLGLYVWFDLVNCS